MASRSDVQLDDLDPILSSSDHACKNYSQPLYLKWRETHVGMRKAGLDSMCLLVHLSIQLVLYMKPNRTILFLSFLCVPLFLLSHKKLSHIF